MWVNRQTPRSPHLGNEPNLAPQPAQLELPNIDSVQRHAAGGDVIEALDEGHDRGLACKIIGKLG